jgi:hypothetical protein
VHGYFAACNTGSLGGFAGAFQIRLEYVRRSNRIYVRLLQEKIPDSMPAVAGANDAQIDSVVSSQNSRSAQSRPSAGSQACFSEISSGQL